ncbi:MAG: hypothetical protein EYC70_11230 [Planctomycetota bacterium]|nr:MAG: hypothetical protein EYC70_11230 [Planctomycetota bacterium]
MHVLAVLTLFLPCAQAEPAQLLLVSGYTSDSVDRYNAASLAWHGRLDGGPLNGAQSITLGPDGLLYVCSEEEDAVLRYAAGTGAFVDAFVDDDPGTPVDETGGLDGPTAAVFGPDGHWYVASFNTDAVLRYQGSSGAFLDVFVPPNSANLNGPDVGMIFGPDGSLYVPSYWNHTVKRYDALTGAPIGTNGNFVAFRSGGLANPRGLIFSGAHFYVASEGTDEVLRYDAISGAFVDEFVWDDPATGADDNGSLNGPCGMEFGPDGQLYVTSVNSDEVLRFDGSSGDYLDTVVAAGANGVDAPTFLRFVALEGILLDPAVPGIAGQLNTVRIFGATAGERAFFAYGFSAGSTPVPGCLLLRVGIAQARLGGQEIVDSSGEASFATIVPAAAAGRTVLMQVVERRSCRLSNLLTQTLQ